MNCRARPRLVFSQSHLIKKVKLILRNKALLYSTILGVGLSVYMFFIEPNWIQVNHLEIEAQVQRTYKFIQLSDIHMKEMTFKERRIISKVKNERPDAIFITGDLVLPELNLEEVGFFLKELAVIAPIYTISGNWEHWVIDPETEYKIYKKSNVKYLKNTNYIFNSEICILGLDDYLSGSPDFSKTILGCEATKFKLALFHSPGWIDTIQEKIFDLGLAGHTHGGQIRLPFYTPITPPGSGDYISGFYEKNRNKMYVSRGLGQSIIQARLLSRPEIVVIDLVPQK